MQELVNRDGETIRKGRISPALRTALQLIVSDGLTVKDAAMRTGYTPHSLTQALKKPHVKAEKERVRRAWMESQREKAWVTVAGLAAEAQSEDVQLKAARTILDHFGDLKPDVGGGSTGQRQLIQIVTNTLNMGGHPLSERLPGVVERPPLLDITPTRQTREESDE